MRSNGGELAGAWNFRDVAEETGIRPGRFFRSSELSGLDDDGRAALSSLGITDVADLRSVRELERRGEGQVPDGVSIHHLPFHELASSQTDAPHESAFEKIVTERSDDEDVAGSFPGLSGSLRPFPDATRMTKEGLGAKPLSVSVPPV